MRGQAPAVSASLKGAVMVEENPTKADLVRWVTHMILSERVEIEFRELRKILGGMLGPIRQDFAKSSLVRPSSGIELVAEDVCVIVRSSKQNRGREAANHKLTTAEFVLRAVWKLRKPPYHGILAKGSGFNAAFRKYFSGLDPVKELKELETRGIAYATPHPKVRKDALIFIGSRLK